MQHNIQRIWSAVCSLSFIFMLHSSGMHLHCVQLLFCILPGCIDYMWYKRERASRSYRNDILSTMQPLMAGRLPWVIITATLSSSMLIQGARHHLLACSSTLTDCSLSYVCFHWIPADLHRHQQEQTPSALGQNTGLIRINRFGMCHSLPKTILHLFTHLSDVEHSPRIPTPIFCCIQTWGGMFL